MSSPIILSIAILAMALLYYLTNLYDTLQLRKNLKIYTYVRFKWFEEMRTGLVVKINGNEIYIDSGGYTYIVYRNEIYK